MGQFAIPGLMENDTPETARVRCIMRLLPAIYKQQWEGITAIGPVTFYGNQPAYVATAAKLVFFADDMEIVDTLHSADSEVLISDPALWLFSVPKRMLLDTMKPGLWKWDFLVESNNNWESVYYGVLCVQHAPEDNFPD